MDVSHQFSNRFIRNLASLVIKQKYRYRFASQEHSEQRELMFVMSQIAQLGKGDKKPA